MNMNRGGGGGNGSQQVSDTLLVNVTELRYPVDEKVLRDVFQTIAPVTRVQMVPQTLPNLVSALVQFPDARAAQVAMTQRNNRHIYSDCNKMEIVFAAPEATSAPIFASPPMGNHGGHSGMGGMGGQQHHPGMGGMMGQGGPMGGGMGIVGSGPNQQMMMMNAGHGASMGGGMGGGGGQSIPGMGAAPMGIMVGGRPLGAGGAHPQPGPPSGGINIPVPGMGQGQMGGMGGPGPMGMTPNPMAMAAMMAQYSGMMFGMPGAGAMAAARPAGVAPFVSVNEIPPDTTLNQLFAILEVWGSVASIRRTQRQGIVHVRMFAPEDADAVAKFVHKCPFFGAEISARSMPTFVERNEIPAGGDPDDLSCNQYDFRQARHRHRTMRCRCVASSTIRLHLKKEPRSDDEVRAFFTALGTVPTGVEHDSASYGTRGDDILVRFESVADAVRAIVFGNNKICDVDGGVASFAASNSAVPRSAVPASTSDPGAEQSVSA